MERRTYYCLDILDFVNSSFDRPAKIEIIKNIIEIIDNNVEPTNRKVESMALAQLYFKRAVFILGIYVMFLFISKSISFLFPCLS